MTDEAMTEQTENDGREPAIQTLKRRGLLAAAWAAVAAVVAMRTSQPVEAATGGGADGNLVLSSNFNTSPNTSSDLTIASTTAGNFSFPTFFDFDPSYAGGTTANINALYGHGKGLGAGVIGVTGGGPATGIFAIPHAGVAGYSFDTAVGGMGLLGEIPAGSAANAIAIYGLNNSSFAGPGPGAGGFGVYGLSAKGHGLVGATAAAGAAAVVGATNGVAGAYAGAFYGPVIVSGNFTVVGGAKSAAVPHPDGSHRLLYCVESPESWFEDFGDGQLDCGSAEVTFDPDFAAVADTDKFHVFVTEYDQHNDLFVTKRTKTGFRVEAKEKEKVGPGGGAFSWRVVAKRRDIPGERLAKIAIPSEPQLPPLPPSAPEGSESNLFRATSQPGARRSAG